MTLPKRSITYADYLALPDDERYELVEGELLVTPSPLWRHQKIQMSIGALLWQYAKAGNLGSVTGAPMDVVLSDETVLQPDVMFISRDRESAICADRVFGAPDLIVEILSPSTAKRDLVIKRRLYQTHGVREYWIVDPESNFIEVLTPQGAELETWQRFWSGSTLESPLLPDLRLDVSDILAK